MTRFIVHLFLLGLATSGVLAAIVYFIPPVNGVLVALFLTLFGISLATLAALPIYYLRLFYGPKDSPRLILRRSLKLSFFLTLSVVGILVLQLFGAANLVSLGILVGLVFIMERLT